ncbi:MAG: hypothetical protein WCL14_01090 [Bacteroidota bacterium]
MANIENSLGLTFIPQELEMLELIKYFKERLLIENPKSISGLMDGWIKLEEVINYWARWKADKEYLKLNGNEYKWDKTVEVICPECKNHLNLKPVGEIMLEDGHTYLQFYCDSCYLNFESDAPNMDDESLMAYYENIIENKDMDKAIRKSRSHVQHIFKTKAALNKLRTEHDKAIAENERMTIAYQNYLDGLELDIASLRYKKKITKSFLFKIVNFWRVNMSILRKTKMNKLK